MGKHKEMVAGVQVLMGGVQAVQVDKSHVAEQKKSMAVI
jgi:hypothetical protein